MLEVQVNPVIFQNCMLGKYQANPIVNEVNGHEIWAKKPIASNRNVRVSVGLGTLAVTCVAPNTSWSSYWSLKTSNTTNYQLHKAMAELSFLQCQLATLNVEHSNLLSQIAQKEAQITHLRAMA
jgi:hypothetical protein